MSTQATQAALGYGSKLQIGDGATPTEVFTEIFDVTSIKETGGKPDMIDTTNFESPNKTKEYVPGLKDTSEVAIDGSFTSDAGQAALETAFDAVTAHNYKLVINLATPKTWSFKAVVTALTHDISPTGVIKFTATLKLLGAMTKA